jgi:hypothetical protein
MAEYVTALSFISFAANSRIMHATCSCKTVSSFVIHMMRCIMSMHIGSYQRLRVEMRSECLIASPRRDYSILSAVTDAWVPACGSWVGDYPYVDREAFKEFVSFAAIPKVSSCISARMIVNIHPDGWLRIAVTDDLAICFYTAIRITELSTLKS